MSTIEDQVILDSLRFKVGSLRAQFIEYSWRRSTPEYVRIDDKIKSLDRDVCAYGWVLFPENMGR